MAPMSRTEFHLVRDELGWTLADLARYAKRDNSRVRKMASGSDPIDQELSDWLRKARDAQQDQDWAQYRQLIDEGVPIKRP